MKKADLNSITKELLTQLTVPALIAAHFYLGQIAQSVEQRTENPCVPGSIPGLATSKIDVCTITTR